MSSPSQSETLIIAYFFGAIVAITVMVYLLRGFGIITFYVRKKVFLTFCVCNGPFRILCNVGRKRLLFAFNKDKLPETSLCFIALYSKNMT